MAQEKFYLELSEGGSHKFYELLIDGKKLTTRFGRIGDAGQASEASFPTPEKAQAEATKKLNEKLKKGYAHAVMGERAKRSVTRRSAMMGTGSQASRGAKTRQAPVLWSFNSGTSALGISIDKEQCWVGNEAGEIFAMDHSGKVHLKFKLPDGVKSIVRDAAWIYASCDDGNVYDLSGKAPRVAYSIAENVDIFWIDIHDGLLAVSDALGNVSTFNHEEETQWSKKSKGDKGWMVRVDEVGVYHGHSKGVTRYNRDDGKALWTKPTNGWIGFGWQEEGLVFASTANGTVHRFTKKGDVQTVYTCDSYLCSCATAPDGKYVFAGDDHGAIYCFNEAGERLWKLDSGHGAAQSMQYFEDKVYVVTHQGYLACIDASEAAIADAQRGVVPKAKEVKAPKLKAVTEAALETTRSEKGGVVVECFREGSQLRVRVVSPGFERGWHVQFPRAAREEGARYVVEQVLPSARGGFYRALGDIQKLVT
jgi:outer membrane protein assembly factor BamB